MRPCDIDMTGEVWIYRPQEHKTAHHGHERLVYLGPLAQAVLKPFLEGRAPWSYCFSPRDAAEEGAAQASTHRRPDQKPDPRKTDRSLGDRYTTASYRRAIAYATKKAEVPDWHPHQIRHSAATIFRKAFGLDAASILLGHKCLNTDFRRSQPPHFR